MIRAFMADPGVLFVRLRGATHIPRPGHTAKPWRCCALVHCGKSYRRIRAISKTMVAPRYGLSFAVWHKAQLDHGVTRHAGVIE